MNDHDVIVIGSGPGGLTAALALARAGQRVLVLEQHYLPGGWCHSFTLDGFEFSPGVHYIGGLAPGGTMRAIYEGLGVAGDIGFLELNPDGYDHVRVGSERFDICKGRDAYGERLKARFPRHARAIDRYLDVVARMAAEIEDGLRVRGLAGLLTLPLRAPMFARYGWMTLDRFLDGLGLDDPVLRAVLTIQAGDHGMAPSRAPVVLHAAVAAHYFDGAYYPRGGGKAIPRAFIKALRRHGGAIRVRARVERILTERAGGRTRAIGVGLADGTELRARHIVSNADPHVTYGRLLPTDVLSRPLRRRLERTRYSISSLSLFLATDMDVRAAGLDSGNVWIGSTARVEDAYDYARDPDPLRRPDVPGAFLTVTTLKDPGKRRDGLHTMESFAFVSHEPFRLFAGSSQGARPAEYEAMKEAFTARILARLEQVVPGLSRRIVFRSLGTPLTNVHYVAATEGNLYGTEKTFGNLGPLGFPVRTEIDGLVMCGASTLSHGVAGATASGLAAARAILRCRTHEILTERGASIRIDPCEPEARAAVA